MTDEKDYLSRKARLQNGKLAKITDPKKEPPNLISQRGLRSGAEMTEDQTAKQRSRLQIGSARQRMRPE